MPVGSLDGSDDPSISAVTRADDAPPEALDATVIWSIRPHSPQPAHRPDHWAERWPQAPQTKCVAVLGMSGTVAGTPDTGACLVGWLPSRPLRAVSVADGRVRSRPG
jgi:hypothetical protein